MLSEGFIKLHRSLLSWEWYDDINTTRLFIHLILTANYYDKEWHGIIIKRGQRICPISRLALETRLSVQQIRSAIKRLKSTNEITSELIRIESTSCTLFTVFNYNKYQLETEFATSDPTIEQQVSNKWPTSEQHIIKKDKNNNKDNKARNIYYCTEPKQNGSMPMPPKAQKAESVISIPTTSGEMFGISEVMISEWAKLYPGVDIKQQLRNMVGWCEGNPSKRKTNRGMLRFIHNWLSKEQNRAPQNTIQQTTMSVRRDLSYLDGMEEGV